MSRRARSAGHAACLAAAALLALLGGADPASAHAFAQRYDLPLPLWHYLVGAGAAVALSFAALAMARSSPLAGRPARIAMLTIAAPAAVAGAHVTRAIGIASLALLLAAGFVGPRGDWDSNLLPVAIWIIWWVGLAFACALIGDVWRLLDPWRGLAALAGLRDPIRSQRPWSGPAAENAWPAVALFMAFSWAELVWPGNADPRRLGALVVAYGTLSLAATIAIGPSRWRRSCDPFARFFDLFARCAPIGALRLPGGRVVIVLRVPGGGLAATGLPSASQAGFVILALSTVAFDGFAETPAWEGITGAAHAGLYATGFIHAFGYATTGALVKSVGLVAAPLAFLAAYGLACAATGRIAGEATGRTIRRFSLSLVPIAVGYHLAHYLAYLLIQGQAALPLITDPLGLGWDLFGTRGREIDIGVIDAGTVWLVAVAAIVAGHAASVALADIAARRAYGARAVGSQVPLAALMVGYTMFSLWILSQPIVNV